uniref:Protein kinase domain-containing protein n=1 Tax=Staphylothermus marinus TaxID=2280 RepID=A0A7J3KEA0_STAMA
MSEKRREYGIEGSAEPFVYIRRVEASGKDESVFGFILDFNLSKLSFEMGVAEDLFVELFSSHEIEDVVIEFLDMGIPPLRIGRVSGRILVPVKLEFAKKGVQEITVKISYEYLGKRLSKEKKFSIEVKESSDKFFKDYRILGLIGRGASASVYKVVKVVNGEERVLALKKYERSDKDFVNELAKIVQLTEKLKDVPYVVRVVDYGVQPVPFIVMEYYPMNLRIFIENPIINVSLIDRLKIMLKISKVMAYASSIGVHHGDLKPENILVKEDQGKYYPVVADWGGGFTPCYSAPEVFESGQKAITEKSDVWSFGVILYEIYTQEKLFKNIEDYVKRVKEDIRVELDDKKLADIINKCLRLDPDNRPSFSEIVSEIRDYISIDLASRISKDRLDYLFEKASLYVEKGDISSLGEVLNQLKKIASYDESTSVIVTVLDKMGKVFYHLSQESKLNVDKILPLYKDIFEIVDEDLRAKLEKDEYTRSIIPFLEYYKAFTIDPQDKNKLIEWTDRLREVIVDYYNMKIKRAVR